MTKFTSTEISYLRHFVENAIRDKKKLIANHERHWNEYSPSDQEWANNRITEAEQKIDEFFNIPSKLDTYKPF